MAEKSCRGFIGQGCSPGLLDISKQAFCWQLVPDATDDHEHRIKAGRYREQR